MNDACGCGHNEPTTDEQGEEHEPERLWQVSELQFAAVSGVLLLAALIAGVADAAHPVVLTLEALALVVGAYTFVPSTLKRLAKGKIGVGTLMTIQLALASLALGLVLGLLGALAKTSPLKPLQWLGGTYSTLVRGVPELLWVLLIYFGTVGLMRSLADLLGMESLELSAFAAGTIALGLCFGAYATEVFRGAILAIPKGHREAGLALGLSAPRIFWRLILPQMLMAAGAATRLAEKLLGRVESLGGKEG